MKEDKIKEGDQVRVYWEHIESIEGEVCYVPCATGDSWTIKSANGDVHNVQMFGRMTRKAKSVP